MDMWASNLASYTVSGVPLWVILLCGVLGVLVDIDHPVSHYWLTSLGARFLHIPVLVIGCIILCVALACVAGLLVKVVLKWF